MTGHRRGSPYAPHGETETAAMLDAVGATSIEELFDIPEGVRFADEFGIEARSEREARAFVEALLERNEHLVELLGRGHYDYYVPSMVEHLADRSEFLTSYTQYQPEVSQGFLQVLFEYQSLLVELTGLPVANCSMYDAATALGEAATLAARVRSVDGDRVLVPEQLSPGKHSTLENYLAGTEFGIERYPADDGVADLDALAETVEDSVAMVYAETPTLRGPIEPNLTAIGELADDAGALFTLGSDPIALSLLQRPADVGADVVVGDASVLGLPASYGMGLGLFATRETYLRQVPGRLVGASEDDAGRRAYTLTLQTREQHIRRERATSNICTNQAWVALRAAMHAAWLGPEGLVDLAERDVERVRRLAAGIDDLVGARAPVHDRHHLREFVVRVDQPADAIAADLREAGYLVHSIGAHELQICVAGATDDELEGFQSAFAEVVA